jgi:hypothetical protein
MWKRTSYSWKVPQYSFERFIQAWRYLNMQNFSRGTMHYCESSGRAFATVEALPETQNNIFLWLLPLVENLQILYEVSLPNPGFCKGLNVSVTKRKVDEKSSVGSILSWLRCTMAV